MFQDIIRRHPANPILTADDIPGSAMNVFNSGLIRHEGRIVALLRVEQRSGLQSIRYAESPDGIRDWRIDDELMLVPTTEPHRTYEEAIYDPRITRLEGTYYCTYASENRFGCQVGLARSADLRHWEKREPIALPDNRNIVLFPERIGQTPNVCLACAAIPSEDGDDLAIYYGGADQVLCLATARLPDLLDACLACKL